jgi:hypothetical protein
MRTHSALASIAAATALAASAAAQSTIRASVSSTNSQANAGSFDPAISADGAIVAFYSPATNLVTNDTNGVFDVFVRNSTNGTTVRASIDTNEQQANDRSQFPSISWDGRFVAFESRATNLVTNDTNAVEDVFVRDLLLTLTTRVSVATGGAQANAASFQPAISGDGRFVVWHSAATNLVTTDVNGATDVFLRDKQLNTTALVSVATGGVQGNQGSINAVVSSDGRYVAFESDATNLVAGDTNTATDVFVRDRTANTTVRASVASGNVQGNAASSNCAISGDGRFIAFESLATNLVALDTNGFPDVFLFDRQAVTTQLVSRDTYGAQGGGASISPAISPNGRIVAFTSFASNLVPGDANGWEDILWHDRLTGATQRSSVSTLGVEGNGSSVDAALSNDGRFTAFTSFATNLISGDTNSLWDIFVRDRGLGTPTVYCTSKVNSLGCTPTMAWSGIPSTTNPLPFAIVALNEINNKNGLLFYGYQPNALPFQGGTLCEGPPTRRTPAQNAGGNPPPNDCSGVFSYDFNQRIQSGIDPALVVGADVFCQWWARDPLSASTTSLSDALAFTIAP